MNTTTLIALLLLVALILALGFLYSERQMIQTNLKISAAVNEEWQRKYEGIEAQKKESDQQLSNAQAEILRLQALLDEAQKSYQNQILTNNLIREQLGQLEIAFQNLQQNYEAESMANQQAQLRIQELQTQLEDWKTAYDDQLAATAKLQEQIQTLQAQVKQQEQHIAELTAQVPPSQDAQSVEEAQILQGITWGTQFLDWVKNYREVSIMMALLGLGTTAAAAGARFQRGAESSRKARPQPVSEPARLASGAQRLAPSDARRGVKEWDGGVWVRMPGTLASRYTIWRPDGRSRAISREDGQAAFQPQDWVQVLMTREQAVRYTRRQQILRS